MGNNRKRTKGRNIQFVSMPISKFDLAKINPITTNRYNDVSAWIQGLVGPMYVPPTKYKKITHQ